MTARTAKLAAGSVAHVHKTPGRPCSRLARVPMINPIPISPLIRFIHYHSEPFFAVSPYFSSPLLRNHWIYDDDSGLRFKHRETKLQEKNCRFFTARGSKPPSTFRRIERQKSPSANTSISPLLSLLATRHSSLATFPVLCVFASSANCPTSFRPSSIYRPSRPAARHYASLHLSPLCVNKCLMYRNNLPRPTAQLLQNPPQFPEAPASTSFVVPNGLTGKNHQRFRSFSRADSHCQRAS